MKLPKPKHLLLLMFGFFALKGFSQLPGSTIFTVAGTPVSTEEFERQFLKSFNHPLDSIKNKDLDEYLRMYTDFKLKYKDARDAGLDTLSSYQMELAGYRKDLARNFLFDKEVTENLIKEGYERWQYEVRVKHILILINENPTPADTLAAYKKISAIAAQLKADPSQFDNLAKTQSDDVGTKENAGDLGYMTAFQVVYPFETAAYNTNPGEISGVFRTQFGYHIVKVMDKRKNRGEVKARRLLLRVGHRPEATEDEVKRKIDEIYNKLKSGEATMDQMARSYSDDFHTRGEGGFMDYFSACQKVGDLEWQEWAEKIFSLSKNGEISAPFRTASGWHIVQRLDLRPFGTMQQLRSIIKNQVQNDMRAQKSVDALIAKVKAENNYSEVNTSLQAFISSLDTNFIKGDFKKNRLPKFAPEPKPKAPQRGNVFKEPAVSTTPLLELELFSLGGEKHTVDDFSNYIQANIHPASGDLKDFVKTLYTEWTNNECVDYQDRHLEEKNLEFRYLYQEYREGILMFNRMQEKVWDKANNDSVGLANFHKQHTSEFMWGDRFDCQVFLCASEKIMNSVAKELGKKTPADSIKKKYNAQNPLNVDFRIGKYEVSDSFLFPTKAILEKLFSDPKYRKANKVVKLQKIGADWVVVKVVKFVPSMPKTLEETRGPVAAKYQDYLEKQWIEGLRAKYTVVVNDQALQALKEKLAH